MNLIVETDIGHDPDDLFAICYLIAAGVDIKALLVTPGDPDQIAIAKLILDIAGVNAPVGVSHLDREKYSSGSIHHDLLRKYGKDLDGLHDGEGIEIMQSVLGTDRDCELFVIGPVCTIGAYFAKHPRAAFTRATMQGGFLPYHLHRPSITLSKFENKNEVPTFNLNGDRSAGERFLAANIAERRMVGKNICHTVEFNANLAAGIRNTTHPAARLFAEAATMYFARHDMKKFHDPTAAVLHLHPEIGEWYAGQTVKSKSGWTTTPGSDFVLKEIDYDSLWLHLLEMI